MVIKVSSARQVDRLVEDLRAGPLLKREAAVARLTLVGATAVDRIVAVILDPLASSAGRAAALRTAEAIGDIRGLGPALEATTDANPEVACAAVTATRAFLRSDQDAAIIDCLAAIALDHARADAVRLAALAALEEVDRATIAPVLATLQQDPSEAIRKAVGPGAPERVAAPGGGDAALVIRAAEGTLPDDPALLRRAVAEAGRSLPFAVLARLIEQVRLRETHEPDRREAWTAVRGTAHLALAGRGSRVAVFDLRETIEHAAGPLPADFVTALLEVGDVSCLETLAASYEGASRQPGDWTRQQLGDLFRAIAEREHLTRRHAAIKRILKRWPAILEAGPLA